MNWYEPNKTKKKKPWRAAGIIILAVVLLGAAAFAFFPTHFSFSFVKSDGNGNIQVYSNQPDSEADLPEDFRDFFETYYTSTDSDSTEITIPKAENLTPFSAELVSGSGEELTLQELYEKCSPYTVSVSAFFEDKNGYAWGSGVIIGEDGYVITNTHVIDESYSATVQLIDGREYEARLVGADSISDLALLKIEPEEKLPAAELADLSSLRVGDACAAIGSPLGDEFRNTLTNGIVSAIERDLSYNSHSMTLIQTNTALNEGNSGGALFDMQGRVIGITNMKMSSMYSSIEGIGFAIPSTTVQQVVNSFMENGVVLGRPYVGITVGSIPTNVSEYYGLPEGLYVSEVKELSDAYAAGIRVGDVITALNGSPVTSTSEVNTVKDSLSVGDSMTFTVYREGEYFDVEVTLMDSSLFD